MKSTSLLILPCKECNRDCGVVRCPRCKAIRWLTEWSVHDDCAECPACERIVNGYDVLQQPIGADGELPPAPGYFLCMNEVTQVCVEKGQLTLSC